MNLNLPALSKQLTLLKDLMICIICNKKTIKKKKKSIFENQIWCHPDRTAVYGQTGPRSVLFANVWRYWQSTEDRLHTSEPVQQMAIKRTSLHCILLFLTPSLSSLGVPHVVGGLWREQHKLELSAINIRALHEHHTQYVLIQGDSA